MRNTTTTTTTAASSCRLWLALLLMLLALMQVGLATPAWWHHSDAGYDASLDPVAWSRAFVQDKVRRPRISRLGPAQLPAQLPALSGHRLSWWRSGYRNSNGNYNNHGGSRRSNYQKLVRRHRKRMTLRHTKLSQSTSD